MNIPDFPISTDRLSLRLFEPGDLDGLYTYLSLPDSQRYLDAPVRDIGEARAELSTLRQHKRLSRPGETLSLAVCTDKDDCLVGHVSLKWTDATASQAELRFLFDPRHSSQRYASEAVGAALDLAFGALQMHRVFVRSSARHTATVKLLKALGMRLEAHYREHALFQGEWDEELHFAILDREWRRGGKVHELKRPLVA